MGVEGVFSFQWSVVSSQPLAISIYQVEFRLIALFRGWISPPIVDVCLGDGQDMKASRAKTFTALLEPDGTNLRWVIARVPFDLEKTWPVRNGQRVRGEMEGFAFRNSLFPDPRGEGHCLLVTKKMLKGARARVGDKVHFTLEPDMEERPIVIPLELAAALKGERVLRKWFDAMSPSMRRYIGAYVDEAKGAETRMKRADKMAERLMQAMEGEAGARRRY